MDSSLFQKLKYITFGIILIVSIILNRQINQASPSNELTKAQIISSLGNISIGLSNDGLSHPPPTSGPYAYYKNYGSFGPDQPGFPNVGQTYIDPVFGTTIKRLTNTFGYANGTNNYAKNGFWNADGTLYAPGNGIILNTTTGEIIRNSAPGGYDISFAPDNSDILYYFYDNQLRQYSVSSNSNSLVKDFGANLESLGGSVDWIDASGRYMLLIFDGQARIYDKQTNTLYSGGIPVSIGVGYVGISPDAKYVIVADGAFHSYTINHLSQQLNTTGILIWDLCGDHGDIMTASNGKTYVITHECYEESAIYAVDVSIPQQPKTTAENRAKQRSDNKKLLKIDWNDTGHISAPSKGPLQDWVFTSIESVDDTLSSQVTSSWRPYEQEIIAINILTGEVRRLAHHRSRGITVSYEYQPRINASGDGSKILWTSNMGYNGLLGYNDIYMIDVASASSTPTSSPTISSSPSPNPTPNPTPTPTFTPTPTPTKTPTPTFSIGSRVKTTANLKVRTQPSTAKAAKVICIQSAKSLGTIIGGPVVSSGYTWWNINYDTKCDGWSAQAYLKLQ